MGAGQSYCVNDKPQDSWDSPCERKTDSGRLSSVLVKVEGSLVGSGPGAVPAPTAVSEHSRQGQLRVLGLLWNPKKLALTQAEEHRASRLGAQASVHALHCGLPPVGVAEIEDGLSSLNPPHLTQHLGF